VGRKVFEKRKKEKMENKIKLIEAAAPKLQFIEALVKAQLEFKPAEKNSDNLFSRANIQPMKKSGQL